MGARRHVGALLDRIPATLRNWIRDENAANGERLPQTSARSRESEEVRALETRVAEPERANEILRTSDAFFRSAELDRRIK